MKLLATIKESDVEVGVIDREPAGFSQRTAARGVVLNKMNEVALLWVSKQGYHKLPGGGVEGGEGLQEALRRELLEETGYEAEIIAEIGEIVGYRDKWGMKQLSKCYLMKQVGEQKPAALTQEEEADGFEVVWAKDIADALSIIEADEPLNYDGKFITQRDRVFLKLAQELDVS